MAWIQISRKEYVSGKYQYTSGSQKGEFKAWVNYDSYGDIDPDRSYTESYRKAHKLGRFAEQNNNEQQEEQRSGGGGAFFAAVLIAAASEAAKKGSTKPITKHAQKPTVQKPGVPKVKKAAPIPKRQIGKPVVSRTGLGMSAGTSIGTSSPKKKLFAGTKPAKPKPIKPANPVASASKKRAIASGATSKPTSKQTMTTSKPTSTKSKGMFGSSSSTSSKKSGGMFGSSSSTSSKKSGGMFGGAKRRK